MKRLNLNKYFNTLIPQLFTMLVKFNIYYNVARFVNDLHH